MANDSEIQRNANAGQGESSTVIPPIRDNDSNQTQDASTSNNDLLLLLQETNKKLDLLLESIARTNEILSALGTASNADGGVDTSQSMFAPGAASRTTAGRGANAARTPSSNTDIGPWHNGGGVGAAGTVSGAIAQARNDAPIGVTGSAIIYQVASSDAFSQEMARRQFEANRETQREEREREERVGREMREMEERVGREMREREERVEREIRQFDQNLRAFQMAYEMGRASVYSSHAETSSGGAPETTGQSTNANPRSESSPRRSTVSNDSETSRPMASELLSNDGRSTVAPDCFGRGGITSVGAAPDIETFCGVHASVAAAVGDGGSAAPPAPSSRDGGGTSVGEGSNALGSDASASTAVGDGAAAPSDGVNDGTGFGGSTSGRISSGHLPDDPGHKTKRMKRNVQ